MESSSTAIISLMGTAIAALFGTLMAVVWSVLKRQDKRIETLEAREATSLTTIAKNVETVALGMQVLTETIRELRLFILSRPREREQG